MSDVSAESVEVFETHSNWFDAFSINKVTVHLCLNSRTTYAPRFEFKVEEEDTNTDGVAYWILKSNKTEINGLSWRWGFNFDTPYTDEESYNNKNRKFWGVDNKNKISHYLINMADIKLYQSNDWYDGPVLSIPVSIPSPENYNNVFLDDIDFENNIVIFASSKPFSIFLEKLGMVRF